MLRYVKNGMLLLSVAYIVIGMLLLIMPETSLLWICNIFGVVVLVTGIVCLIQYARIRGTGFTAPSCIPNLIEYAKVLRVQTRVKELIGVWL